MMHGQTNIKFLPVVFVIKTIFIYQFFKLLFFNKNFVLDCILCYLDNLRNTKRCLASDFSLWWLRYVTMSMVMKAHIYKACRISHAKLSFHFPLYDTDQH